MHTRLKFLLMVDLSVCCRRAVQAIEGTRETQYFKKENVHLYLTRFRIVTSFQDVHLICNCLPKLNASVCVCARARVCVDIRTRFGKTLERMVCGRHGA